MLAHSSSSAMWMMRSVWQEGVVAASPCGMPLLVCQPPSEAVSLQPLGPPCDPNLPQQCIKLLPWLPVSCLASKTRSAWTSLLVPVLMSPHQNAKEPFSTPQSLPPVADLVLFSSSFTTCRQSAAGRTFHQCGKLRLASLSLDLHRSLLVYTLTHVKQS